MAGRKSMVDARLAPLQTPYDLDTRLSISLQALHQATRDRGNWEILTYATMMVFVGWHHCLRHAHEGEERYAFFVEPLTLVVYIITPDPRYPYANLSLRAAPTLNSTKYRVPAARTHGTTKIASSCRSLVPVRCEDDHRRLHPQSHPP